MKLSKNVYVVGGGRTGFGLSGRYDCHVYVVDGVNELALIDPGLGWHGSFDTILDNIRADGLDTRRIRKLILTHYHCDHIGAAAEARTRLDLEVIASSTTAIAIRAGDEDITALTHARAAGGYPADYHLTPCPVDREVSEGDVIQVGNVTLNTYETPGHSAGHLSFLAQSDVVRPALFGGDLLFSMGRILLQNIPDCSIPDTATSIAKIVALDFEALFPGHLQIVLRDAREHALIAHRIFTHMGIPPNAL